MGGDGTGRDAEKLSSFGSAARCDDCVRSTPLWLAVLLAGRGWKRETLGDIIRVVAPLDAPCKQDG